MSTIKKFTKLEMEEMKINRYTLNISERYISFTYEFKKEFWRLSKQGYTGRSIFIVLGYDPDILGFDRVHNTTKRIRKAGRMSGGLKKNCSHKIPTSPENILFESDKNSSRMQNEIIYLQQQMSFLKKLMQDKV